MPITDPDPRYEDQLVQTVDLDVVYPEHVLDLASRHYVWARRTTDDQPDRYGTWTFMGPLPFIETFLIEYGVSEDELEEFYEPYLPFD